MSSVYELTETLEFKRDPDLLKLFSFFSFFLFFRSYLYSDCPTVKRQDFLRAALICASFEPPMHILWRGLPSRIHYLLQLLPIYAFRFTACWSAQTQIKTQAYLKL